MFLAFTTAFLILFISVLRTAEIRYDFNPSLPAKGGVFLDEPERIEYYLPYPGNVLPDSPLWALKALRDRLWYIITTDAGKKADLLLLFADKRLNMALTMFGDRKAEVGFTTLTKAEKYLELASAKEKDNRARGIDTSDFLVRLATAALKHYEIIQTIIRLAPDDARPAILDYESYSQKVYQEARDALMEKNKVPPENPFIW